MRIHYTFAMALLMSSVAVSQSFAQLSPVRLTVTKHEDKDYVTKHREHPRRDTSVSKLHETDATLIYSIEVVNAGAKPLAGLEIRWGVLIDRPDHPLRMHDGKEHHDLKPGEKFSFDTDVIELNAPHAKVDGYSIEAVLDGKVVASAIEPANAKERIESLKPKRERKNK